MAMALSVSGISPSYPPSARFCPRRRACRACHHTRISSQPEEDATLRIVDCATSKPLLTIARHIQGRGIPAIMPDGRRIVFPIDNGKLGVLDLAHKSAPKVIDSHLDKWSTFHRRLARWPNRRHARKRAVAFSCGICPE